MLHILTIGIVFAVVNPVAFEEARNAVMTEAAEGV
jgi:hypothetical protein